MHASPDAGLSITFHRGRREKQLRSLFCVRRPFGKNYLIHTIPHTTHGPGNGRFYPFTNARHSAGSVTKGCRLQVVKARAESVSVCRSFTRVGLASGGPRGVSALFVFLYQPGRPSAAFRRPKERETTREAAERRAPVPTGPSCQQTLCVVYCWEFPLATSRAAIAGHRQSAFFAPVASDGSEKYSQNRS